MLFTQICAVAALSALTRAGVVVRNELPEGSIEVPMQWSGVVRPGEAPVTLEGTMQAVWEKVLQINPNYEAEIERSTTSLEKRQSGCSNPRPPDTVRIVVTLVAQYQADVENREFFATVLTRPYTDRIVLLAWFICPMLDAAVLLPALVFVHESLAHTTPRFSSVTI